MSNNGGNDSPLAVDIITYIGVPLTVLGILPILFNTAVTLAALSKIKRMLRKSQLTALTRSDVVNRVIEIELPRYAVTPWDRFQHRSEYWHLSRSPSSIPGGTWTTFNWKRTAIGIKTQRIEYADQLRQPQVEVAFDELICYLLDLGAKPDAQGWRILRTTGQWTPVGCALMRSPNGEHKALTIAPADDSDGNLSLAVIWCPEWTARDSSSLPPYWVRLSPPPPVVSEEPEKGKELEDPFNPGESSSTPQSSDHLNEDPKAYDDEDLEKGTRQSTNSKNSLDSVAKAVEANAKSIITCQISTDGLVNALTEEHVGPSHSTHFNSLYIEHLRIGRLPPSYAAATAMGASSIRNSKTKNKNAGTWFSSAMTAFGTTSQTVLWNFKIPDDILSFVRKDTVPCGVLVLLGLVAMEDTPEWATSHDEADRWEQNESTRDNHSEWHRAVQEEMKMPPAERTKAQMKRMQREQEAKMKEMRLKRRRDEERAEQRALEALQSPRWDNARVAEYALSYLTAREHLPKGLTGKDAVEVVLHTMVLDGEFAGRLADMLDLWKGWAENGGMRKSDYTVLKQDASLWCMSALLVALIGETANALAGTLAMDLQECLGIWKKVRLG
ncbi:hypothetical protein MKZ38_001598 [Zalerion maritima]|uniref:Uncharacterized protein n=1 Tax=Zalerion maritima TaxID=339359 RepID=A0AAD5RRM8_9PEZI|nr:hypothetical protein MKZ38_001598 [Zalerion maritima]